MSSELCHFTQKKLKKLSTSYLQLALRQPLLMDEQMLNVRRVLRKSTPVLKSTSLLTPDAHEVVWGFVLAHIYWKVPCSHPFPKCVRIKFHPITVVSPPVWRVAVNDIAIFMLIVSIVHLSELHLGQVKPRQALKSQKSMRWVKYAFCQKPQVSNTSFHHHIIIPVLSQIICVSIPSIEGDHMRFDIPLLVKLLLADNSIIFLLQVLSISSLFEQCLSSQWVKVVAQDGLPFSRQKGAMRDGAPSCE